jgi:hypothetical protein
MESAPTNGPLRFIKFTKDIQTFVNRYLHHTNLIVRESATKLASKLKEFDQAGQGHFKDTNVNSSKSESKEDTEVEKINHDRSSSVESLLAT